MNFNSKTIISRRFRWEGHIACKRNMKQARTVLVGKHERKRPLVVRWEHNINMNLKGLGWLKGWTDCI